MNLEDDLEWLVCLQALKNVNTEIKVKYPDGRICFFGEHKKGSLPGRVSCAWYNKYAKPGHDSIANPPEWQNLTYAEAKKIGAMFGRCLNLNVVPVTERP